MDKLELKHLAPYLPYGLKYKGTYGGISTLRKLEYCRPYNKDTDSYSNEIGVDGYLIQYIKPILRPLSDLTKLINYGLSSYIFIELFEIGDTDGFIYEFDSGNIKLLNLLESISIHNNSHDINYLPYPVVEMMYEKHFDVFGLIEQGLAIDINTLKNEK